MKIYPEKPSSWTILGGGSHPEIQVSWYNLILEIGHRGGIHRVGWHREFRQFYTFHRWNAVDLTTFWVNFTPPEIIWRWVFSCIFKVFTLFIDNYRVISYNRNTLLTLFFIESVDRFLKLISWIDKEDCGISLCHQTSISVQRVKNYNFEDFYFEKKNTLTKKKLKKSLSTFSILGGKFFDRNFFFTFSTFQIELYTLTKKNLEKIQKIYDVVGFHTLDGNWRLMS